MYLIPVGNLITITIPSKEEYQWRRLEDSVNPCRHRLTRRRRRNACRVKTICLYDCHLSLEGVCCLVPSSCWVVWLASYLLSRASLQSTDNHIRIDFIQSPMRINMQIMICVWISLHPCKILGRNVKQPRTTANDMISSSCRDWCGMVLAKKRTPFLAYHPI